MPGFIIGSTDARGPSPTVETARSHRWRIEIYGTYLPESPDVVFYAHSCTRPSIEIDPIKMHHRQNEINLPGKYRYGTITLKFYEKITADADSTAEYFHRWWSKVVTTASAHTINPTAYRTRVAIYLTDGAGKTIHWYKLHNAWPAKVEGSELDYSVSEIATITVTIVFDWADEQRR